MRKGTIAVLSLVLAAAAPAAVEAKSYNGDGYRHAHSYRQGYSHKKTYGYRKKTGTQKTYGYRKGYGAKKSYGYRNGYGARKTYGYNGYRKGYGYKRGYASRFTGRSLTGPRALAGRAMTGRAVASLSAGTSTTCLTADAQTLLGRIRAQFGNVEIVSTCRPGATIAGTNIPSKHASGQAIDFRVPGRKAEVVRWLMANDHMGGIMTYSDMDHIHVDVGARFVALNRPSGRT
jgi:hypothetical protein